MAAARAPRVGLFAYAACLVGEVLLGLWSRHLLAVARASDRGFASVETQLDLLGYGYTAIGVATVAALVVVARGRVALASRPGTWAAIAAGLAAAMELGQRALLSVFASGAPGRLELFLKVFGLGMVLSDTVARVLVAVVAFRVGRAVASRATLGVAVASLVAVGVAFAVYVVELSLRDTSHASGPIDTIQTVVYYAATFLVASAAILAGRSVSRVPGPPDAADAGERAPEQEALSPRWRAAADGIGLYLGGAAGRVVCALLGYAAMAGAGGGGTGGSPDLHAMHDSVLVVAMLSGIASLVMLTGVWRITRAPPESNGTGAAMVTLCLMILGFALDLVTTSITLDALGGSLSAAFFAMDALPVLGFGAASLGVGAGIALLKSFGGMAQTLGAAELEGRAKSAMALLGTAGGIAAVAMLGLKHMPVELLALVAIVVLPLAIATLVQFLRVAVPLGRVIRGRLAAGP
jgi:hypothetical protein